MELEQNHEVGRREAHDLRQGDTHPYETTRSHILKPNGAQDHPIDKAFVGVWGVSGGGIVALVVVWPFLCTMNVKGALVGARLISFLAFGGS